MPIRHPRAQWVLYEVAPQGIMIACEVCGQRVGPLRGSARQQFAAVDQFAAAHQQHVSAAPTHYGAGDLVARATKALGIAPCTPCERRRQALNQMMPRVLRR